MNDCNKRKRKSKDATFYSDLRQATQLAMSNKDDMIDITDEFGRKKRIRKQDAINSTNITQYISNSIE